MKGKFEGLKEFFALQRNVVVISLAIFFLGLGENLWAKFIPKYLEALGAGLLAVGFFGAMEDFLDAVYQYPGGVISDKIGRKSALVLFNVLGLIGFLIYFFSLSWQLVFLGLFFVMGWTSFSQPATFAIIGDSLPKTKRAIGFTVQSILKRLPIIVAPPIGGLLIAYYGMTTGVKNGLFFTIVLAFMILFLQNRYYVKTETYDKLEETGNIIALFKKINPNLKKLLLSDIFIRTAQGLSETFIIFYTMDVIGITSFQFGTLIAVQMTTSVLVYTPIAKLSDRIGRKPFVILTFIFFSLFPLSIALSKNFLLLLIAFIIGGLREIGEPPRKAMIVDLSPKEARGRAAGLYYLIRGLAVTPASVIGGFLYKEIAPQTPFTASFTIGMIGVLIFSLTVKEKYSE